MTNTAPSPYLQPRLQDLDIGTVSNMLSLFKHSRKKERERELSLASELLDHYTFESLHYFLKVIPSNFWTHCQAWRKGWGEVSLGVSWGMTNYY